MPTPRWTALAAALLLATPIYGEIKTTDVDYEHDGVALRGFLAVDAGRDTHKGAVLIVHEWWGLNDYARSRATQLAELGYVAFAVDMYGRGKVTDDPKQAGQWAGALYQDRALLRARAAAGLAAFHKAAGLADDAPVAAIGYCFGGTTVTELAYSNAPGLVAVVSFHGNPKPALEDDRVSATLLFCHGDADPLVKDEELEAVGQSLDAKDADWMLIRYSGAKHSFTNPKADAYGMDPVGYDEAADKRSWQHMLTLFDEVFGADAG